MRRLFCITTMIMGTFLILTILLGGCAKPTPSPAPSPASKLAPAPTPAPTAPARRDIELRSGTLGSTSYVYSHALSTIINSVSPWLRTEVLETGGSVVDTKDMLARPEKRRSIIFMSADATNGQARSGVFPFTEPYTGGRAIAAMFSSATGILSYNKNINAPADFVGKRVGVWAVTMSSGIYMEALLQNWGVWDKIKMNRGTQDTQMRLLRDGTLDIAPANLVGYPGRWTASESLMHLLLEKPGVHFVPATTPADHPAVMEKTKQALLLTRVRANEVSPGAPDVDIWCLGNTLSWWCDQSMDDEVVTEVLRQLYENINKMKEQYPASVITRENMAMMAIPNDWWHPAALKFFQAKGVPVGVKF